MRNTPIPRQIGGYFSIKAGRKLHASFRFEEAFEDYQIADDETTELLKI